MILKKNHKQTCLNFYRATNGFEMNNNHAGLAGPACALFGCMPADLILRLACTCPFAMKKIGIEYGIH